MSSSTDKGITGRVTGSSPAGGTVPTRWLAFGLVALVGAVLLGVNLLDPPLASVDAEQFKTLLDEGMVSQIRIRGRTLECALARPVRLRGERAAVSAVQIEWGAAPDAGEVSRWEQGGVQVLSLPEGGRRDGPWAIAVALLLAGGIWHLVAQARRHRRDGSPRERLQEAERQFGAGELTREQYDNLVAELTIEM